MADFSASQGLYRLRGFGRRIRFGSRPALLVVDVIQAFTDPTSPLGSDPDTTVAAIQQLLEVARAKGLPIIFTKVAYDEST